MILAALVAVAPAVLALSTATVTVESRTVVRIVRRAHPPVTPPPPLPDFRERHGPRCLPAGDISAAAVTGPSQVDFALRGGMRVRAILESACPALDFYQGFYLSPSDDGQICADRESIRTRSGGECVIDRFRKLEVRPPPKPPKAASSGLRP